MKNGIIINGVSYKVVRNNCLGTYHPCEHCDLKKKCDDKNTQPCGLFDHGYYLAHFKKIEP